MGCSHKHERVGCCWKSMAIVEESQFKSTNIVTEAYNSGMAALIIAGWRTLYQGWIPKCAEHCGQSSDKMSLQSFEVWMQWLDYQLYIWTSSIILWDVGSILRHFTPGISAAWVIIAVSGGDEDILKPGLWIWVQLLARTWASMETAPLTATTLEVHWLHRSWHHYERPTPCKDWTFLGRIRLNKPPFARPMSHDVTMLHTNQGHPKGIHTDVVDGLDKFWH